jgi:hypothetical protein
MGFKKQSPVTGLPVGAQRQMREMDQKNLSEIMADPVKREEYQAGRYNLLRATQRKKEEQDLKTGEQQINLNDLNMELVSGNVKDMKRTQSKIDAAISQYPDLSKVNYRAVVRDFIRQGKPIDSNLMTATLADPGAKQVLEMGIQSELKALEHEYSMRLKTARDPNTSMLLLRTLTEQANQIETTQQRLLAQRQMMQKSLEEDNTYKLNKMAAAQGNKEAQKVVEEIEKPLKAIDTAINTYMQEGLRIQAKTSLYADQLGLPTDADVLAQQARQAIAQRPEAAAQIREMYKAQTGKDLK